jgi:diguanylate cyclase (GGDEF)-like protein
MHDMNIQPALPSVFSRWTLIARGALKLGYPMALLIVAVLCFVAYLLLNSALENNAKTGQLVNVAGRQRMLSQRIALHALRLRAANPTERATIQQTLLETIDEFQTAHEALLRGDNRFGPLSDTVRNLYLEPPVNVDASVREYLRRARAVAAGRFEDLPSLEALATGEIIEKLEVMVRQYELEGVNRIRSLQTLETVALGVTLLALVLEALFIFRPLERRTALAARTSSDDAVRVTALLENAKRDARERDLLERVQLALSRELELEEACRVIVESVAETFGYPLVSLCLRHGDGLELAHHVGYPQEVIERVNLNDGVLGRVMRNGEAVLLEDVTTDADFIAALPGITSEICVPLRLNGETIGVFGIESIGEPRLGASDLRLVTALAAHVEEAIARAALYREARDGERQAAALLAISRLAQEGNDPTSVAREVAAVIGHLVAVDWVGLVRIQDDAARTETIWHANASHIPFESVIAAGLPRGTGVIWKILEYGRAVFADDYASWSDASPLLLKFGVRAAAWVPIGGRNASLALTAVRFDSPHPWTERETELLEAAARSVTITFERSDHLRQLEAAAFADALTGLGNRRAFESDLERATAEARRHGHTVSIMNLDLDGLKMVNDTHGHERGDALLRSFARALRARLRAEDRLYRFGGDEFAAILSHAQPSGFDAVRNRVHDAINDLRLEGFPEANASAGLAAYPLEASSLGELVRLADARMYEVKLRHRAARAATTSTEAST